MSDQPANISLKLALEQAALAQSQAGVDKIDKQFAALKKDVQDTGAAADKALSGIGNSLGGLRTNVDANIKAVNELRDSLTKIKPVGEILGKSGSTSGGGIGVEGLRRTGGALTQLGAGGAGELVRVAGDVAEVTKSMKDMATVAIQLPGIFGQLAQAGAGLGAAAGTTGAAFGALLVPIAAIALPVGALALAIGELKKQFDAGHNAVAQFLSDQAKEVEFRIQATEKAKTMTSEEVKARQEAIQQEIAARGRANQDLLNQDADLRRQYAETGDLLKKAGLVDTMKQIGTQVDEQNKKIKELSQEYKANHDILDPLVKKRQEETAAIQGEISAIEKKIAGQQQDAQLLQSGTAKGVEDRIQALENEKKAIEDNLPALEDQAKKSKEGEAELKKYKDRLAEINKEQSNLNNNILPYLKAKEDEKKAYQDAIKGTDEYVKNQQKYAELIATGSSEDIKKRVDAIEREKQAIQDGLPALDSLGESNEEAKQRAIEQRKRIDELNAEESKLTTEIKAAVEAREAEQKAVEKTKQQAGIVEKLEDDKAAIVQKSEEEQAAIKERSARARADIEDKYGQKLVEIARSTADEAAKALEELQQKQTDLRTSLARDEEKSARDDADKTLDIQIKAQRAERDALQEHVARLEEIRKSDYAATQKDLLDRNFLSIYQRRLSQNEQIEQENSKFAQGSGKRQQSINDEVQDAQRQSQIARRERLIAFQQQQQDAQLNYQRQLVAAKQAHDREIMLAQEAHSRELVELRRKTAEELSDLQKKTAKELQTRQTAAAKELQLLERTEAQRLEIIAKYAKKAQDILRAATVPDIKKRAGGGGLETGDVSWVNDGSQGQRESFNGTPFPPGLGLFIPAQNGSVSPGGAGGSQTNHFYIRAHDTEGVKREVVNVLKQVMH